MFHKFKLGQRVHLRTGSSLPSNTDSRQVYEIIRLMPANQDGELGYRIRAENTEHAVVERQLLRAD